MSLAIAAVRVPGVGAAAPSPARETWRPTPVCGTAAGSGQNGHVPSVVPPSRFVLTPPPDGYEHDLWAAGADLAPGTLLAAYRVGLFPMPLEDVGLGWFSPATRGVIPVDATPPRTVRRAARLFEIRVDTAFSAVIAGCADPARPGGWIDDAFVAAYSHLHELGCAHSIEAWDAEGLAGGLYGVASGGLFAAESMFHRRSGASKAALHGLLLLLRSAGNAAARLLDIQWATPQLEALGATEVSRATYHRRLARALELEDAFGER
jgi:leucyl/phenylalanyl-tRNA--protein transferase